MDSKKILFFLIPVLVLAVSCPSGAKPQASSGPVRNADNLNVSREQYDATKEEVQHFIGELNQIIREEISTHGKIHYRLNTSRRFLPPKIYAKFRNSLP